MELTIINRIPWFRYCLKLLLVCLFALCIAGTCHTLPAKAGEFDWAIPSGPLPDVPTPSDPVVVDDGNDDSDSTNTTDDTNNVQSQQPDSSDNQTANLNNPPVNQPPVEPTNITKNPIEIARKAFQMPAELIDTGVPPQTVHSPVVADNDDFGEGPAPKGLSDSEWQTVANCQKALDAFYEKWPLSSEETLEMDRLQKTYDALWQKAVNQPGLTQKERNRLRLKLHTLKNTYAKVSTVSKKTIGNWIKPPPLVSDNQNKHSEPTVNPVTSWLVGQFAVGQAQSAIELAGELKMDHFREENSYGDVLGVGKIAVAYKNGGVSSAIAESANFLIGKIKAPVISMAAGLGVEGGRQYSNVVFQAQNKFMSDAMKAVSGDFDQEQFWSDFKKDCNEWQLAVMEWIGYGTE